MQNRSGYGNRPPQGGNRGYASGGSGGGSSYGGGGGDGGASAAQQRVARRLQDQGRIVYFKAPAKNDEKPAPRPELLDEEAEAIARKLAGIPASQLRRFYGAVKTIKRQLDLDRRLGADFIKGELALLKAKGAYALVRLKYEPEGALDPDEFLTMLVRNGRSVEDRASFMAFVRHFEAVMAYHKVFEIKKGGNG